MKQFSAWIVFALLAFGTTATTVRAQCLFPHPRKDLDISANLVQAFVPCGGACFGGGSEGTFCSTDADCAPGVCRAIVAGQPVVPRIPNTTSGILGTPACSPPLTFNEQNGSPANGWVWAAALRSIGQVAFSDTVNVQEGVDPAHNPFPTSDRDVRIKLSLSHIFRSDGFDASGLGTLVVVARSTFTDRTGGDMTDGDFTTTYPFQMYAGEARLKTSANAFLNGAGEYSLPSGDNYCSSLEFVDVIVLDPNGAPFARLGSFAQ